jgi:hypothetical protein
MSSAERSCWRANVLAATVVLALISPSESLSAQPAEDLHEIQRHIEIFASVLREGLGLNQRTGLFSALSGSVRGTYLADQGVMLEITSPLMNQRSAFNMQSLGMSLQQLSGQLAELQAGRVPPPDLDALRESMALMIRAESLQGELRELVDGMAAADLSAQVEASLREASEAARTLRGFSRLDDAGLAAVQQQINALRASLQQEMSALGQLRSDVNTVGGSAEPLDDGRVEDLNATLNRIIAAVEPVRAAASQMAQGLWDEVQAARQEQEQAWQSELAGFEASMFMLICDYAAALRSLPSDQRLTIVLKGLGDETEERREDRFHVLRIADMQRCLQGELSSQQLQNEGISYSF